MAGAVRHCSLGRRALITVLVAGVVLAATLTSAMAANGQGDTLAERGIGFGAYAPPAPWSGMEPVRALEAELGTRLDVVSSYHAWGDEWGQLDQNQLEAMSQDGRVPLLTWEPWTAPNNAGTTPGAVVEQPKFRLSRIAAGAFDGYVRSWARQLRQFGELVYLRPMHEMNGNWYPWSGVVNGNTPEDYVRAWRHLHEIFRAEGADNVRWVWSPLVDDVPAGNDFEQYWPGSRYVDVLALDGYNWGADRPEYGGWRSFDEVFAEAYARLTALGPEPVWLTEVGAATAGGDKAAWVRRMLASTGYERLEAIVWFHADKERDWRLTAPPDAAAAAATALSRRPADRDHWTFRASAPGGRAPESNGQRSSPSITEACPPARVAAADFVDTSGNTHQAAIACLAWREITRGISPTRYGPDQPVTRGQMATFVARALRGATTLPQPTPQGFTDIAGTTHHGAIRQLSAAGIVHGVAAGTYAPDRPVSRAQMATFLVRSFEHASGNQLATSQGHFADVADNTHEDNINKAAAAGFVAGTSSSTYAPAAPVRRDQMASFIARMLNRLASTGHLAGSTG